MTNLSSFCPDCQSSSLVWPHVCIHRPFPSPICSPGSGQSWISQSPLRLYRTLTCCFFLTTFFPQVTPPSVMNAPIFSFLIQLLLSFVFVFALPSRGGLRLPRSPHAFERGRYFLNQRLSHVDRPCGISPATRGT